MFEPLSETEMQDEAQRVILNINDKEK